MPIESEASSPPATGRFRAIAPFLLAAFIGFGVADAWRPPRRQLGSRAAIAVIDAYRATVSPLLDRSGLVRCRFVPSCSAYGREAIARYGLPRGALMAAGRIVRCNPFSKGGVDPVP